ncbi:MAG TPA: shikimate kinase [Nitrososphaeraceae archaeon]|nr:shikimate kinase [Nitrososphaeraceae archaeon]
MNRSIRVNMHGAVSVVNAVANGHGSALGISLKVVADLSISAGKGIYLNSKQGDKLLDVLVRRALPKTVLSDHAVHVEIKSEIPAGFGLKSSSAVTSAVALAIQKFLGDEIDHEKVLNQSADASIEAGISLTGAFDDSAACYFGGFVVTNNFSRKLIRREPASEDLSVIILLPARVRRGNVFNLYLAPKIFDLAFKMASDRDYWNAMKLNGMAVGALLGSDYAPVVSAMKENALSAGISGNGPSVVAISNSKHLKGLVSSLSSFEGQILISKVNNQKATVEYLDG